MPEHDPSPGIQPPASPPAAGPLLHATLVVADVARLIAAYAALGLEVREQGLVEMSQAMAWRQLDYVGCTVVELAAPGAATLLRLIEQPLAKARPTRFGHGWLALEILVRDVDALWPQALAAGFEIVGPPADLDVSPHIRAMQLMGPVGEMLYLTQVKAPVPPFELPLSADLPVANNVGPLFIGVMSTASRAAALAACAPLAPKAQLQFDTKITVLNRALQRPLDERWPVATVQWDGGCLFEIDEVQHADVSTPTPDDKPPPGLAWLTMAARGREPGLYRVVPGVWLETVEDVPLQAPAPPAACAVAASPQTMPAAPGAAVMPGHESRFIVYVEDTSRSTAFYASVLAIGPRLYTLALSEFVLPGGGVLVLMPRAQRPAWLGGPLGAGAAAEASAAAVMNRVELHLLLPSVAAAQAAQKRALQAGALALDATFLREPGHQPACLQDPDGHVLVLAWQGGSTAA